jgi:chitin disaccharide deacetylase
MDVVICGDDFGLTETVNEAIIEAHYNGSLTHASIISNAPCFEDAATKARAYGNTLKVGLHINLSFGKPITPKEEIGCLTDNKGNLTCGFLRLLTLPILKGVPLVREQVEREIENQLLHCRKNGITITHIDSHRHIHAIPWMYKIVEKLAHRYGIPRIRVINERLSSALYANPAAFLLSPLGIVKLILLRSLTRLNKQKSESYFFSIIHSCKITDALIRRIKIPKQYTSVEIMLHPSRSEKEKNRLSAYERKHLTSFYRDKELETALLFGGLEKDRFYFRFKNVYYRKKE